MGVERLARRSFGFVVAALVALAIYFQASGTVELVAAKALKIDAHEPGPGEGKLRKARHKPTPQASHTSGDPILARNPFDSVTGPLDRAPIVVTQPTAGETARHLDLSDPLNAPECDGVIVNIVSESPDPEWSLAQLKGPGDTEASTRRVGDDVGKLKVAYIGYNASKASPAVWLVTDDRVCQALMYSEKGAKEAPGSSEPAPAAAAPPSEDDRTRRARRGAPQVPSEISDKIQRVSETEFNVDRAVIDNILENQATLMRSARIVPEQKDGKTVGIRLFGIRSDTLLGTLGMQNGDRLEKINGFDMASPEKALEAYARLRTATSLTVQVTRRGKPLTIEYKIN
jgi:general secretion pathway protein C